MLVNLVIAVGTWSLVAFVVGRAIGPMLNRNGKRYPPA